ncbi:MAG TPA: 23S rRNA (pseudouridine(1915)-N(3))-methyltransferase RlmH [Alphaproteobacteria bacterium]|nr:23S rRNA (pseudouridine(1915)-N(3))-methyltransferase RlmH [Alphaproteobacteria bacterium]
MKIVIAAVGRLRDAPSRALFEDYAKRLSWPVTVREVELKRALSGSQAKAEEGRLLLEAIGERATLVALDEHGAEWSSADFAGRVGAWRDQGVAELAFAIGGADGHAETVLKRAAATVAFGRMTWPHRLARVMLVEQIYRAQQIIAGHPYHRE